MHTVLKPTGHIAIDAKFPWKVIKQCEILSRQRKFTSRTTIHQDIKKHIQDIAEKYIIPIRGSSAIIILRSVFAEIHAHCLSWLKWHKSPCLDGFPHMMAVLTTVRAVLKDETTSHAYSRTQCAC